MQSLARSEEPLRLWLAVSRHRGWLPLQTHLIEAVSVKEVQAAQQQDKHTRSERHRRRARCCNLCLLGLCHCLHGTEGRRCVRRRGGQGGLSRQPQPQPMHASALSTVNLACL